jgi:hypothetical protein
MCHLWMPRYWSFHYPLIHCEILARIRSPPTHRASIVGSSHLSITSSFEFIISPLFRSSEDSVAFLPVINHSINESLKRGKLPRAFQRELDVDQWKSPANIHQITFAVSISCLNARRTPKWRAIHRPYTPFAIADQHYSLLRWSQASRTRTTEQWEPIEIGCVRSYPPGEAKALRSRLRSQGIAFSLPGSVHSMGTNACACKPCNGREHFGNDRH